MQSLQDLGGSPDGLRSDPLPRTIQRSARGGRDWSPRKGLFSGTGCSMGRRALSIAEAIGTECAIIGFGRMELAPVRRAAGQFE